MLRLKETLYLRWFGLRKIPLVFFVSPSVIEMNDERCELKIPLNRRTRNHLNSMYFGTLCVGADLAGGLIAMRLIESLGAKINLVFKDFKADFLKRAEGNVHFSCEDGEAIRKLIIHAQGTGERENMTVNVLATVPSKSGAEPVARFELTLSLKKKTR